MRIAALVNFQIITPPSSEHTPEQRGFLKHALKYDHKELLPNNARVLRQNKGGLFIADSTLVLSLKSFVSRKLF
jgi:hypothetical protein